MHWAVVMKFVDYNLLDSLDRAQTRWFGDEIKKIRSVP